VPVSTLKSKLKKYAQTDMNGDNAGGENLIVNSAPPLEFI
jgi:hypothetical protein